MQLYAFVSDSQMPQRGHLDGLRSRKPEAMQLGGGPVGEDGTSLDPEMCGDEILYPARRCSLDPVDPWVQALPTSTGDAHPPHLLGAPVLKGLVEMEHSELA